MMRATRKRVAKPDTAKLKKLVVLARDLRAGEHFEITRLTALKSWCQDPLAAGRFAFHLAEQAKERASKKYKPLITNALRQLEEAQNEYRDTRWGRVRTIDCREALLGEGALRCVFRPWESTHWGYQVARPCAERFTKGV